MLNVAIIEDEVPAIHRLTSMIEAFQPTIQIEVVARTGKEAIAQCMVHKPNLIFLDIHLPDMKGFQVIEALDYSPYVIFTTAYANYAIRAFQTWAVDYLLKPFDRDQLFQSISKYISIISTDTQSHHINWNELARLFDSEKSRTSFTVKSGGRIRLVDYDDIVYIVADDKYTKVQLQNGKSLHCDYSLKEIELSLGTSFLRVHRSTIINTSNVSVVKKTFKGRFVFNFTSDHIPAIRSGASYKESIIEKYQL